MSCIPVKHDDPLGLAISHWLVLDLGYFGNCNWSFIELKKHVVINKCDL